MKIDKSFILRLLAVFIATLVTVGAVKMITNFYGQGNILITFILAILVAQVYEELIDPRRKRQKSTNLVVMQQDISNMKAEIEFLKYYVHKTSDTDLGELKLESSIWKELDTEEDKDE